MSRNVTIACLCLVAVGCSSGAPKPDPGDEKARERTDSPAQTSPSVEPERVEPPTLSGLERFSADIPGEGVLHATIKTSMGDIDCALFEAQAPVAVANFIGLATGKKDWVDPASGHLQSNSPFYDGTGFHRVIPHFFIQAGDPTGTGTAGPGYTIPDEISDDLSHKLPGMLSMANRGAPDTSGSQWFITEAPIPHLDGRHTIFGYCPDSLEVVRRIARVPTGPDDQPQEPPEILQIEFSRRAAAPAQ